MNDYMLKKLALIIVRYENDKEIFQKDIINLAKHIKVYIYDNSKESVDFRNEKNIYLYHDKENGGLAKAINNCVDIALKDGNEYAVYFDQDSVIDIYMIEKLLNSYKNFKIKNDNLFVLGPQATMPDGENYPIRVVENIFDNYFSASEIITSGMTFRLKDIQNIGYFDEELFLDLVDFDICWRAVEQNKLVVVDRNIKMVHEVGIETIKIPFKVLPISSPIRNYYQMRNMLYCAVYKNKKTRWIVAYYILRRLVNVMINLLFADEKMTRLKYNILGVKDALKKRMGKFSL